MAIRDYFSGSAEVRMDDKGRVTLPARYRAAFSAGVMLTKGQDRCLYVFTEDGFERFAAGAIDADITDEKARGFQRYLLANTEAIEPDGQGRIGIPARMREYAGLTKNVVVAGAGRRMEIWNADEFAAYQSEHESPFVSPERGLLNPP